MLDDFLHETTADPLNDIMSFLGTDNKETKPQGLFSCCVFAVSLFLSIRRWRRL